VRGLERDLREGLLSQAEDVSRRFLGVREELGRSGAELEARLRKEVEDMMEALAGKVAELQGTLGRVEGLVARRDELRSVDDRLARLEEGFSRVASHVESIDSLTPELRLLGEKLLGIRVQLGAVDEGIGQAGRGVGDLREVLSARVGDLHALVEAGIQRWEADQSQMLDRLSAIRDTLRDQLRDVGERAESLQPSLWGKLTGRKDESLKLSREEWDRLSAKIEGIISGLESILARRQEKPRQ
jgi:hypothetical protein